MKVSAFVAILALGILEGCHVDGQKNVAFLAGREVRAETRQWYWAQPMQIQGVPNFYKVSDELYRGDEPSVNGMKHLRRMGVRTAVCVRSWEAHSTEDRAKAAGLQYDQIKMVAWAPTDREIIQFFRIMANRDNRPVFIHCYTGGDRVGLLTAFYRVAFGGWSKEEAMNEMLYGGYSFHEILMKYYLPFFQQADIEKLKRQAGMTEASITEADRAFSWETITRLGRPTQQMPRHWQPYLAKKSQKSYNPGNETNALAPADRGADGRDNVPDDNLALRGRDLRRQQRP